ncbi:ABC transporter permease [Georgenia thermotolerans]|uniref:Molybdate ABC transporter permease subunit n=1 Tax=Georgenia thermotolerans TaxID=527326 RepID=A0A7J5UK99_9MICO|nr:ABC transporter permease [Georgenia thermotolerans]KAE8762812.1 molybdate ABC transporter permease subunit [Georgenia thermotolerans]
MAAPAAVAVLLLAVPVLGMLLRVPWARFPALLATEASVDALLLSLRTSLAATALCVLLGVPLALVLARTRWPGQRVVRTLVLLPLVLPPVVSGLALLTTLGRRGLLGARLEALGIDVAFTTAAVVLAQTFVSLPFLVLSLEGAVRTAGHRYEDVAATLGARPTTVLRRVTLPLLLPALGSGTALAFARSLGEFGATLTFAGSLQGVTRTLPLEIYLQRETDPDAALALSVVLIAVAAVIVLATQRGRRRSPGAGGPGAAGEPDDAASAPSPTGVDRRSAPGQAAAGAGPGVTVSFRQAWPDESSPQRAPVAEERSAPARRAPVAEERPAAARRALAATGMPAAARRPAGGGEPAPGASIMVHASVPERGVDLDVELPGGQVVAVLGPNGAGKSTLLGLLSGLVRPGAGTVRIGARTVADDATWVPPHARRAALLAQEPLLLPHLDALGNVAFGPRAGGVPRASADRLARERLAQVGAEALAGRRPHQLSGGQAQRVALARALAPEPDVLLLDEPLSALDVSAAVAMRQVLRTLLRGSGRTAVLVTHDLLDVLAVADAVVVLDGGRVVEQGPALEVLTRPRSAFAARLAGVNLVLGGLAPEGDAVVTGSLALHGLVDPACQAGEQVAATFSPRAVSVHRTPPGGSPRNVVGVTVTGLEHLGELVRVRATTADGHSLAADITPAAVAELSLQHGATVLFSVKAAEVTIFPA